MKFRALSRLLFYGVVYNQQHVVILAKFSQDVSKLYQSTEEEFYFRPKLDRSPSIRGRYSLTSDKSYFHLWASRAEKTKKKVTEVTEIATEGNNFVAEMLRILEQEDWLSDVWF